MKVLIVLPLAVMLTGCMILPYSPGERSPEARNSEMGRAEATASRPEYRPAKGVIKKGETVGKKDGKTYVCADTDCKTARKTDH